MSEKKKVHPVEKTRLHTRNLHRERYDLKLLVSTSPELAQYVKMNLYNDESIDFANPEAVKALNQALLKHYYGIEQWDIPEGYLCPPIPGRADYIHHVADLLCRKFYGKIPTGAHIKCLDVGVGANCVYPIIGNKAYDWTFIGSDIDEVSIASAQKIIDLNAVLHEKVELRLQANARDIFKGVLDKTEKIDVSICNPPFHASSEEARAGTIRKLSNLNLLDSEEEPVLNFGGQNNELWTAGGEEKFLKTMMLQSLTFAKSCFWFTTLVSKQSNLKRAYETLKLISATEVATIPMGQGNKTRRLVAWTFLSPEEQQLWIKSRWTGKGV